MIFDDLKKIYMKESAFVNSAQAKSLVSYNNDNYLVLTSLKKTQEKEASGYDTMIVLLDKPQEENPFNSLVFEDKSAKKALRTHNTIVFMFEHDCEYNILKLVEQTERKSI